MKYPNRLILAFILFLLFFEGSTAFSQKISSYSGTHFFVGFMENEVVVDEEYGIILQYFVITDQAAEIDVFIPGVSIIHYSIGKDSILKLDIPEKIEVRLSETVLNQAVEISSDVPVTVYGFSSQYTTSDSYTAIPDSLWGREYIVCSMPNDQYHIVQPVTPEDSASLLEPRQSEFMAIAAYDSTVIEFQPKSITARGKQVYNTYSVRLNKGDCYLVKSYRYPRGMGDMSGTIVRANKPFGFLSGHVRTANPQELDNPWDSKDHLVEMLFPTNSWGRHFITVPFGINPAGDMLQIYAVDSSTHVEYQYNGETKYINLDSPGSFIKLEYINAPVIWRSDKPVQLAQLFMHSGISGDTPLYDPSLVIVPPLEQFVQKIYFQTPGNNPVNPYQYNKHFVSVIADSDAIQSLKIDNVAIKSISSIVVVPVPGTKYSWFIRELTIGKHRLETDKGYFSGFLYGAGRADSYAMALGSSLVNPFKNDSIPPLIQYTDTCGIIEGLVSEAADSLNSGIDYIMVVLDSTYNYTWTITRDSDTSAIAAFSAYPINVLLDASIVFDIRDRMGNGSRLRFFYKGIDLKVPGKIEFSDLKYDILTDSLIYLYNTGTSLIKIDSVTISGDERLSLTTDKVLPGNLIPSDSLGCLLEYNPNGESPEVSAILTIWFDCGRKYTIPVLGFVKRPEISCSGFNFGRLRAGDTLSALIYCTNTGNVKITLDSLRLEGSTGEFSIDTAGIFPRTFYYGDTLWLPVKFLPLTRGDFLLTAYFDNDYSIICPAILTGTGIAPEFSNLLVDWGRRRIETPNDSVALIKNTGNDSGRIKYDSFDIFSDAFDTTFISQLDRVLQPDEEFSLPVSFFPADTVDYYLRAALSCDWTLHPPLSLELRGSGTLPAAETIDIVFDTTQIYSRTDSNAVILYSLGNETLSIDSVYFESGDYGSFDIDYSSLRNLKIKPDSSLRVPIGFTPQKLDLNEAFINITHDAAPAFGRIVSSVRLSGWAIKADTLDAEIACSLDGLIPPCQTAEADLFVINTGNVTLQLQSLVLDTENTEAVINPLLPSPIPINAGDTIKRKVLLRAILGYPVSIAFRAVFNDTLVRTALLPVNLLPSELMINPIQDIKTHYGDTLALEITGKFPFRSEIPSSFSMNLELPKKTFLLLDSNLQLVISGKEELMRLQALASQSDYKIEINTSNQFVLPEDSCSWSIILPFWVLLSENRQPEIKINAGSVPCFGLADTSIFPEIEYICIYPIRLIQTGEGDFKLSVNPNPADNQIQCDINLPFDSGIKLELFENSGKNFTIFSNLFLQKGFHSIIFEITDLPNGAYTIILSSNVGIIYKKIIIFKK